MLQTRPDRSGKQWQEQNSLNLGLACTWEKNYAIISTYPRNATEMNVGEMQSFAHEGFWAGTLRGLLSTSSPLTSRRCFLPSPVSPSVCLSFQAESLTGLQSTDGGSAGPGLFYPPQPLSRRIIPGGGSGAARGLHRCQASAFQL